MPGKITAIRAREILDSRGHPTLETLIELDDGCRASASVPSGASTGSHEAVELRDRDPKRYHGRGVLKAVSAVKDVFGPHLIGYDVTRQAEIDRAMIDVDGLPAKARLGANSILSISLAVARAAAMSLDLPLYAYLGIGSADLLPMPMMNILNGGSHASNSLDFQEFMIVPVGASTFAEALRFGAETYHALAGLLRRRGLSTSVGDEGGFAPDLPSNEAACELLVEAIASAGFEPGRDISIALDPAASAFQSGVGYRLNRSKGGGKSTHGLLALYEQWLDRFPIVSIEDGFAEDDWSGFQEQMRRQGDRVQIVGDDIYVTNTEFIARGVREKASNAVLIKPNQVGTVTETIAAVQAAQSAGWRTVVSHRSGETTDTFISDFAVALGCGQIKAGAPCRGERIAKYNRLLEIEVQLGHAAKFNNPFVVN